MRVFSNRSNLLPLLFLVLIFTITVVVEADYDSDDVTVTSIDLSKDNDNNELALEDELMHETIATGRGHRDEVGEREEWASTDHLRESSKFDTRKGMPISAQIKKTLQNYRLECNGCDHNEAVAKINAFVLDAKRAAARDAEVQAQRQSLMSFVMRVVAGVAICVLVYFFYMDSISNKGSYTNNILGGGGNGSDDKRRLQIEDQRRRAAAKQKEKLLSQQVHDNNAPTWVDNEMKEIWTPKQEKQFANALVMYSGMSPKARYRLIAEGVDDKTKQECLMHHKLQQLIAKEK